ncbi:MAG: nucleotidyltransferase family protein [Myxococcota bacterium]|jgi:CTP:molybdopterin cytidylyltransferase MocA
MTTAGDSSQPQSKPRVLPLSGVILAAGEGTRFGGPKALAYLGDESLACLAVRKLRASGVADIIIVTGAAADKVASAIVPCASGHTPPIRMVHNPDWHDGLISSVKAGLAAVPKTCVGAMLLPVNFPLVTERTLQVLAQLFVQESCAEGKIMLPFVDGKPGMPVIVGRLLFEEFSIIYGENPMLTLVNTMPGRAVGISVDDPGTQFAIITRSDVLAAMKIMFDEEYSQPT